MSNCLKLHFQNFIFIYTFLLVNRLNQINYALNELNILLQTSSSIYLQENSFISLVILNCDKNSLRFLFFFGFLHCYFEFLVKFSFGIVIKNDVTKKENRVTINKKKRPFKKNGSEINKSS